MKVLSKAAILKGVEHVETVEVKSLGGKVKIRPLSSGEWNTILVESQKGLGEVELNVGGFGRTDGVLSIDLSKQTASDFRSKIRAVALALSVGGEEWTEDEVEALPNGAVEELFEHVKTISGIELQEREVDDFREE